MDGVARRHVGVEPAEVDGPRVKTDHYRWVILTLAVLTQVTGSVVAQGFYTLVPFWREAFHVSTATAALGVTALNGGQILTMMHLGRLIDRYGERVVVSSTKIICGVLVLLGAAFATNFVELLVLIVAVGAFYAAVQPGGTQAIISWFPPKERGVATGLRQAAVPAGTFIAASTLPLLAAHVSWRAAFVAQGAVSIVSGALFWGFYREKYDASLRVARGAEVPFRAIVGWICSTPGFLRLTVAGIVMSAFQFTITTYAIPYISTELRVSIVAAASIFAIAQFVGMPSRVLIPWLSDRIFPGRRLLSLGVCMLGGVVSLLGLTLLPSGSSWIAEVTVLGALGLTAIGWFPLFILQVAELSHAGAASATVALSWMTCMMAMTVVPYLFGILAADVGYGTAWALLSLPVVASAISLLASPRVQSVR
ncbi:MFS transporter [Nguyenibacter sp. L1]|uniref:MFS transporter n=1 Tax=Nguyenibacter sp. L1 TaxID=3049350 RepID=UPI002B4857CB|nr:MFS transporter [Nguyenibacter sp. L1]WRH89544.1 MFS transporter [Nguyenibacter sp. L1]